MTKKTTKRDIWEFLLLKHPSLLFWGWFATLQREAFESSKKCIKLGCLFFLRKGTHHLSLHSLLAESSCFWLKTCIWKQGFNGRNQNLVGNKFYDYIFAKMASAKWSWYLTYHISVNCLPMSVNNILILLLVTFLVYECSRFGFGIGYENEQVIYVNQNSITKLLEGRMD